MYNFRFPSPKYKYFFTETVTASKRLFVTLQKKLGQKIMYFWKFVKILRKKFNPEQFLKRAFVPKSRFIAWENYQKKISCQIMILKAFLLLPTKPWNLQKFLGVSKYFLTKSRLKGWRERKTDRAVHSNTNISETTDSIRCARIVIVYSHSEFTKKSYLRKIHWYLVELLGKRYFEGWRKHSLYLFYRELKF